MDIRRTETNIFAEADPEFVEKILAAEDARDSLGALTDKFDIPPFSELDCRLESWQRVNRMYINRLHIRSELGRDSDVLEHSGSYAFTTDSADRIQKFHDHADKKTPNVENICSPQWNRGQKAPERGGRCFGEDIMRGEGKTAEKLAQKPGYDYAAIENEGLSDTAKKALGCYAAPGGAIIDRNTGGITGTSIFPPALCHCMYLWFGKEGGRILDPFAGGSVRGAVAGYMKYSYTGIDIRAGQVVANQAQAAVIAAEFPHFVMPKWVVGDSTNLTKVLDAAQDPWEDSIMYDMIFTCPPYYDLEIYSANEGDGSAKQSYSEFLDWYADIFRQALTWLQPNRFVVTVIGEVRDRESPLGEYRNLERDNISVFVDRLKLYHYDRIILKTAVGSLPVRIGPQMNKYRKVGNTHQVINVFWYGERDKAAILRELGEVGGQYAGD